MVLMSVDALAMMEVSSGGSFDDYFTFSTKNNLIT
jgi:hypothetical protein